jgi:hypothetical protein
MREEDDDALWDSESWNALYKAHIRAVRRIDNPPGSGALTLRRRGGGGPAHDPAWLRARFVAHLVGEEGYRPAMEAPAGIDLVVATPDGVVTAFAFPHPDLRAGIAAMAEALRAGTIRVGLAIMPSNDLRPMLGMGDEASTIAAMTLWQEVGAEVDRGMFGLSIVEHDEETDDPAVPPLRLS